MFYLTQVLRVYRCICSFTSISIPLIPPKKTTLRRRQARGFAQPSKPVRLGDCVTLSSWVAVRMRRLTSNMFGAQASSAPVYDWRLISSSTFEYYTRCFQNWRKAKPFPGNGKVSWKVRFQDKITGEGEGYRSRNLLQIISYMHKVICIRDHKHSWGLQPHLLLSPYSPPLLLWSKITSRNRDK